MRVRGKKRKKRSSILLKEKGKKDAWPDCRRPLGGTSCANTSASHSTHQLFDCWTRREREREREKVRERETSIPCSPDCNSLYSLHSLRQINFAYTQTGKVQLLVLHFVHTAAKEKEKRKGDPLVAAR